MTQAYLQTMRDYAIRLAERAGFNFIAEPMHNDRVRRCVRNVNVFCTDEVVRLVELAMEEEREACKAEAIASGMFSVASDVGLRINDAGQQSAYINGWSHGAQDVAARIERRSTGVSNSPDNGAPYRQADNM